MLKQESKIKKEQLTITLTSLILCVLAISLASPVSAKAIILSHDEGKNVGSQTYTYNDILPPEFSPFTNVTQKITQTWNDHWVTQFVIDGSLNSHINWKWSSKATYNIETWFYDSINMKWVYIGVVSQSFLSKDDANTLYVLNKTQMSMFHNRYKETYEMNWVNPFTGEPLVYGYTITSFTIIKWVNGQFQFIKQF